MCFIFSCASNKKYEKRDFWLKHQFRSLNFIDTNKMDIKVKTYVIDGAVAKQKGNYTLAIVNYMLALQYDTTAGILFAISDCFLWINEHNLAIEYALKSLKIDPNFLPCYEVLCRAYLNLNDVKNATIAVECLINIEENEDMLFYLAGLYDYQKSPLAKDIYKKLINEYENQAALEHLINSEKMNRNFDEVSKILQTAIQIHPNEFKYAMDLVSIWFAIDKTDSIIANLRQFDANYSIDELETLYNYVLVRLNSAAREGSKEQADGKKYYQNIIKYIDNRFNFSQILIYNAGSYALNNNDTARAKNYFNSILNIANVNMEVKLRVNRLLANLYFNTNDYAASDSIYEQIITENEKIDPISYNNYAYTLAVRGIQLEKALNLCNKALEQNPSSPEYLDTKGWIYYQMGEYEKALIFTLNSLEIDNKNYEVYEHLSDIYQALGNYEGAIKVIENAIELQPSNSNLLEKRAKIEAILRSNN